MRHRWGHLEIGSTVSWEDPDAGNGSGIYRVVEIITESGLISRDDDALVLADDDGHCTEVYVSELV